MLKYTTSSVRQKRNDMGILDFIMKKRQERKMKTKTKRAEVQVKPKKKKSPIKKRVEKKKERITEKKKPTQKLPAQEVKKEEHISFSEAKELLLKLKAEILETVSLRDASENILQREELIDEADHTIEERQKELSLMLSEREKAKLKEIDEALDRIENKSYGICEECGDQISPERLRYMPYVRYCVDCQDKIEQQREIESGGAESERAFVPPVVPDTGETEES